MERFDVDEDFLIDREQSHRKSLRWKLVLSLSLIAFYVLVGALVFRLLEGRHEVNQTVEKGDRPVEWTYLNSVYFCTRYGDLYPTYWASKLFCAFFVITGLGLVGFSISTLGDIVLGWSRSIAAQHLKKRTDRGKAWIEKRLSSTPSRPGSNAPANTPGDAIEELTALADSLEGMERGDAASSSSTPPPPSWIEPAYNFFWENIAFVTTLSLFLALQFGGALVFFLVEDHMDYAEALYFCLITLSTIGYGDMSPRSTAGKVFLIFFAFFGLGILANFVALLADMFVTKAKNNSRRRREAFALVEIDEMLGRIEDEEIPRLRTSKRALMVQTELLRLAQVAARRVQYLQQCDM